MKLTLSLLLLAAGGLIWVLATRGAPTFVPPAEAQTTYAPAPTVLVHGPAAGQVERDFDVEGMCCKGCTGKLHARLVALPGVHEAAVDFDSGTALVVADSELSVASLQAALTFDKYTATPRSAP